MLKPSHASRVRLGREPAQKPPFCRGTLVQTGRPSAIHKLLWSRHVGMHSCAPAFWKAEWRIDGDTDCSTLLGHRNSLSAIALGRLSLKYRAKYRHGAVCRVECKAFGTAEDSAEGLDDLDGVVRFGGYECDRACTQPPTRPYDSNNRVS